MIFPSKCYIPILGLRYAKIKIHFMTMLKKIHLDCEVNSLSFPKTSKFPEFPLTFSKNGHLSLILYEPEVREIFGSARDDKNVYLAREKQ